MARADPQRVSQLIVGNQYTVKLKISKLNTESPHGVESFADLDTHTDNTVLGSGCLLIHDTGCNVDISGFATVLGSIEHPIVMGAIAYNHLITDKMYILVSH